MASFSLRKALGEGKTSNLIIASCAFAVLFLFYIYTLGTYFKIVIWELQGRVTYYSYFEKYVASSVIDHLVITLTTALWLTLSLKSKIRFAIGTIYGTIAIMSAILGIEIILNVQALLCLPLVLLLISISNLKSRKFVNSDRSLLINYFALIGIGIGLTALGISLQELYFPPNEILTPRNIAYEMNLIFSSFSPVLLILLILCVPFKIIADAIIKVVSKMKHITVNYFVLDTINTRVLTKIFLLFLFMSLSVIMVIIPHQSIVNPDNQDVGVDTDIYVEEINDLNNSTDANEFFNKTFVTIQHGDRPFTLLLFLAISKVVTSVNLSGLFDLVPVILGPLLVLSVYFLTRQLTSNDVASLLSAFMTAVSFHNLVGIYAGSYANWMALIVGYFSVLFVLRSLHNANKINLSLFIILIFTVLFTHVYTWSILTLILTIFLLVMVKMSYYKKRTVIQLLLILSSTILVDLVRTIMTGSISGIGYNISPPFGAIVQLGPELYSTRWSSLVDTTLSYFGSLFGNSIIYTLCLYWLIRSKLNQVLTILLVTFLSIGIIPLFFGNWVVQARVFYDIPFQIPAAIALTYLYRRPEIGRAHV